jgi:hypothetical protein
MDRFLDGADPPKKARSKVLQAELTNCRERITVLSHGKVCHRPMAVPENTQLYSVISMLLSLPLSIAR